MASLTLFPSSFAIFMNFTVSEDIWKGYLVLEISEDFIGNLLKHLQWLLQGISLLNIVHVDTGVWKCSIVSIYKDWTAFCLVNCLENSIYFHCTLHLTFYLDFKGLRNFLEVYFSWTKEENRWQNPSQLPSQACEPELRPREPSSSAV